MRGRYYVRLLGCTCGDEHTMIDPEFLETGLTYVEVPWQFTRREHAADQGQAFIDWCNNGGMQFTAYEIVGVH